MLFLLILANQFISVKLQGLTSNDEMEVLVQLQELSRELLIANDILSEDNNCHYLVKILIDLIDKFPQLPDIALNSLICINNLLEINSGFSQSIILSQGIPKIVALTQNLDFIDLAETSIKTVEKISLDNPLILLENNALYHIINLIEFLELSSRVNNIIMKENSNKCLRQYYKRNKLI